MFNQIRLYLYAAVGLAGLAALWWLVSTVASVSELKADKHRLETQLAQSAAIETRLRATMAAQQRRVERLEAEAKEADALRKQIEDMNDENSAPDWLRDLARRLQQ